MQPKEFDLDAHRDGRMRGSIAHSAETGISHVSISRSNSDASIDLCTSTTTCALTLRSTIGGHATSISNLGDATLVRSENQNTVLSIESE